jgi:hypothetical protein
MTLTIDMWRFPRLMVGLGSLPQAGMTLSPGRGSYQEFSYSGCPDEGTGSPTVLAEPARMRGAGILIADGRRT